ncbi:MAG TPA: M28 family peptidase [Gemmatimonadales bacterium]|nr:M28 family peptidase [Gemmatimonadales bacterium]
MKHLTVWLAAVAGCATGAAAGRGEFDGETALGYVEAQVAFGPRIPNTAGHQRTGDWILTQLQARADTVDVQAFWHVTVTGDTLRLRNFIGRFRPGMQDRILYLAHWDTRPRADQSRNLADQQRPVPGANDGASGVAILLGVADALKRRPPELGVDLLFVDGEDYGDFAVDRDVLLGARHYASTAGPERPLFAVLFDMVGDADLMIPQEGHSAQRAPEVVERVWAKARELGYGRVFRPTVSGAVTDDHIPLLDAGFRAIDVIDFDYPYWHTIEDTVDKVSARSLKAVGDVAVALLR